MIYRKLLEVEKQLLEALPIDFQKYKWYIEKYIDELLVTKEMECYDDGILVLRFWSPHNDDPRYQQGWIADVNTMDSDNEAVSIILDLDNFGDLYELDIHKLSGAPLISLESCVNNIGKRKDV
jgi:hypothetical protein